MYQPDRVPQRGRTGRSFWVRAARLPLPCVQVGKMPAEAQPAAVTVVAASGIGAKEGKDLLRTAEKPGLVLRGRFRHTIPEGSSPHCSRRIEKNRSTA